MDSRRLSGHHGEQMTATTFLHNRYLQLLLRLVLGGLFVWAAIGKISDPEGFAKSIFRYRLLPAGLINILAITLPFVELFAGGFLLAGAFRRGSSLLLSCFLSVFLIALLSALARGLQIDCGCFAPAAAAASNYDIFSAILRDLCMLLAALAIFFHEAGGGRQSSRGENHPLQE